MLSTAARVYRETRKKHDQLFNMYVMRPIAAAVVAVVAPSRVTPNQLTLLNLALFVVAAGAADRVAHLGGGLVAVAVLEVSYCFDCADGMLARFKKLASKDGAPLRLLHRRAQGHAARRGAGRCALARAGARVRRARLGGRGSALPPDRRCGGLIVASAISLTNFVRRPELTGRETTVEAFYETAAPRALSPAARVASLGATFLQWLNHYPSHIWILALLGRMDAYFWVYVTLNALYLGRGWLGLTLRFGRFG